ncbi:MAG: hypothetical protein ABI885_13400 [Gammaproteobacteria bacterium]
MKFNSQVARIVRHTLLMSAVAASASLPAHAQDARVDTVTVTSSRIVRQDFEAPSPVVTVDADTFKMSGEVQVETVLNTLPQLVPSITSTSNNPSNGGPGSMCRWTTTTSRSMT